MLRPTPAPPSRSDSSAGSHCALGTRGHGGNAPVPISPAGGPGDHPGHISHWVLRLSELAASGSTRNTAHARRLFYQSLLATLTKATADMTSALTIAAFEASAADASSATNPAFPPDLTPSDADTDHSDDAEF